MDKLRGPVSSVPNFQIVLFNQKLHEHEVPGLERRRRHHLRDEQRGDRPDKRHRLRLENLRRKNTKVNCFLAAK